MPDTETTAEWARHEPQRSFIAAAEKLQDQGHSIDALADSLLTISLTMLHRIHGPQWVAARLVLLADKYHAETAAIRGAADEGLYDEY